MVDTYRPGILGTTGSFGSIQYTDSQNGGTQKEILDSSQNLKNLNTVTAAGLASLDGGIDVNDSAFTVSSAGAVVGQSLNNSSGGITNAGSIAGVTSMSGSGTSHAGSYTTIGAVTGGSLTDGTATISSGAASGLTTIGSSGAATLDSGGAGSSFGGALTVQGNLTVKGTTTQVDTTNLNVEDKNILINAGGAAASAGGAGIDVEEDGSVSGYMKVSSDRGAWEMKAPDNAGVLTMDINATKTITVAGALNIEADSNIDQDLTTDASVIFAGLNNSSAGITDAGSIAGATSIDGIGDLTMGTITMTGFSVDADGDTSAKSLTSTSTLDVTGLSSLDGGIDVNDSVFTVSTAGAVTAASFTDNTATLSVGALSALASLTFGAESTTMTSVKDEDSMASDSATALATQQSIKAYVDSQVGASFLSGSGDSGTFLIDLDSQVLNVFGTTNEVDTVASGRQVKIGLPSDVTIGNDLTVTNDLAVNGSSTLGNASNDDLIVHASLASSLLLKTDSTYNIGSSTEKLAAIYADNVYTGDFHMKNERGDWTLFEESDHIRIRNNTTGQEFKLDMSPIK